MEEKTILHITLDNQNKIHNNIDLSGIEDDEMALRVLHSILDEHRQSVLDRICSIRTPIDNDDIAW